MNNEELTKVAKEHASEIATLKEQVRELIEFGEKVVEFFQKMQE